METRGHTETVDQLADKIAEMAAHIDAATRQLLSCIRSFDEQAGWADYGARSCAQWLSWRIGLDVTTAREKVRVAKALGSLPKIDDALRRGRLSYAKVRAMTRIATPEMEERLLELALLSTGAQLEKICRGYRLVTSDWNPDGLPDSSSPPCRYFRKEETGSGMVRIEAVLLPDEAALVVKALEAAGDQLWKERTQNAPAEAPRVADSKTSSDESDDGCVKAPAMPPSRADALVYVAESFLSSEQHGVGSGGERYQILVHLEQDALGPDGQLDSTLEDGTRISAEAFRRIGCDASVVGVVVEEKGTPLDVGRRTRTIPPALRRALQARDRGCRFPGCTNTRFVHGHHIEHWAHGGETALENLVLLCTAHHHLVHEGGYSVTHDGKGSFIFQRPDGRVLVAFPMRCSKRDREDLCPPALGIPRSCRNLHPCRRFLARLERLPTLL